MYTAITTAVDFSGAITAIGAVAALLAAVAVARKGAKLVLGFIR
jgi:Na+/H+ antiporter NhaD/arsenite permease-like protein